jgi:hypothetical protein
VESLTFRLFSRQVEVRHRGEVEPILDVLRRIGMEGHPPRPFSSGPERWSSSRVISQAASLAIKGMFLAMAVAGYASLWMAVLADMGTTLLVIFNGMRLLGYRTPCHRRA